MSTPLSDKVWRNEEETAFVLIASSAVARLRSTSLFGLVSEGALLARTWTARDGQKISLAQKKTGDMSLYPSFPRLKRGSTQASPRPLITRRGAGTRKIRHR